MKKSVVITTINNPNTNLKKMGNLCRKFNSELIIIGDKKTPINFKVKYGSYLGINSQLKLNFKFSKICKKNNYARKNIGYLVSMSRNREVILETDDDNYPKNNFFAHIKQCIVREIKGKDWVNIYSIFLKKKMIWPRGLPFDKIDNFPITSKIKKKKSFFLQQGVCEGNPDVDALYRLLNKKINIKFKNNFFISLGKTISPTNSQNTIWFKKYFPLMYLPVTCEMRLTDMWRGIIALNIIYQNGEDILFFGTTMKQIRNNHNLIDDLKQEMPLYKNFKKCYEILKNIKLKKCKKNYLVNLLKSYKGLVKNNILRKKN